MGRRRIHPVHRRRITPAKDDGTPDYNFMERYIRAIEKVTIANTVKWKDKVVATTKNAI